MEEGPIELYFQQRELSPAEEEKRLDLFRAATFESVTLASNVWREKLSMPPYLILLTALYGLVNLIMIIVSTSNLDTQLGRFDLYQNVMFMFINSGTSIGVLNNALMHRFATGESIIGFDPYTATAFLLNSAAIFTHILPAAIMYCWMPLGVFIVCSLFHGYLVQPLKDRLEKRAVSQSKIDSQHIFIDATWRNLMVFVANVTMQALFNYMLLFYEQSQGKMALGGYIGVAAYEFDSRSVTCSLVAVAGSLVNAMQLISSIWV
jgi:hypothetical protein